MRRIEQSPEELAAELGFSDEERQQLVEIGTMARGVRQGAPRAQMAVQKTIEFELDPSTLADLSDEDLEELGKGIEVLLTAIDMRDSGEAQRLLDKIAPLFPVFRGVVISDGMRAGEVLGLGHAVVAEMTSRSRANPHLAPAADRLGNVLSSRAAGG